MPEYCPKPDKTKQKIATNTRGYFLIIGEIFFICQDKRTNIVQFIDKSMSYRMLVVNKMLLSCSYENG